MLAMKQQEDNTVGLTGRLLVTSLYYENDKLAVLGNFTQSNSMSPAYECPQTSALGRDCPGPMASQHRSRFMILQQTMLFRGATIGASS